jgi:UDP-glucose 4-epimerase
MRVLVTGATGNVGTSLLQALAAEPAVEEIVGLARRVPSWQSPRTRWVRADVASDPLEPLMRGVDAVVHLAWLIQPSRDLPKLERVNVLG